MNVCDEAALFNSISVELHVNVNKSWNDFIDNFMTSAEYWKSKTIH